MFYDDDDDDDDERDKSEILRYGDTTNSIDLTARTESVRPT